MRTTSTMNTLEHAPEHRPEHTPEFAINIQGLSLEFPTYHGTIKALTDVTLQVAPGEIAGLVGESGSGKSITSQSLIQLLPRHASRITQGTLEVLGNDVLRESDAGLERIRGKSVSMVFQEPMNALNPTIRVGRQITQVIRTHEDVSEAVAQSRALDLLVEMQIPDAPRVMRCFPFELSGGMRQRVLLAMAFSCNPTVLIADEPTTALDVTVQAQVLAILKARARARGASVLFVSHDLAVVAQLCDTVYVMYAGRIVESGPTADVLRAPAHPYTQALLRSLPEFGVPKMPLETIAGSAPDLRQSMRGCVFQARCAQAHARCAEAPPAFGLVHSKQHTASCWLAADGVAKGWGAGSVGGITPREKADAQAVALAGAAALHRPAPASSQAPAQASSQAPAQALLKLVDVRVHYPISVDWLGRPRAKVHSLNGIDIELRKGETLGVVGESGCGKSTLAQVVMALVKPTVGQVVFDGIDLQSQSKTELQALRKRFQIVFQDPQASLNPRMQVWRLITEPLLGDTKLTTTALKQRAAELAALVGLRVDQLERFPHEFSGGQRQRIAIARALALNPELLLLDEPTSALDVSVQAQILNVLLDLQKKLGLTYLLISHNVSVVQHLADRVAVMYLGQVLELGDASEVLNRPRHPYTRVLLASVPALTAGKSIRPALKKSELPSNVNLPAGCYFRERCPSATAGCERVQALSSDGAGGGHLVRCHLVTAPAQAARTWLAA